MRLTFVLVSFAAGSAPALAQTASPSATPMQGPTETNQPAAPAARGGAPGGATGAGEVKPEVAGILGQDKLLGDFGGARIRVGDIGLTFGLQEQAEIFGNTAGGRRRDVAFEGVTEFGIGLDTGKALGWDGGTVNVTGYWFHGRGLTGDAVSSLTAISSIEQTQGGFRLFEAWGEQTLADKKVAVRVGQIAADQEFIVSQYGGLFLNSGFGFPTLAAADLPSGGPAYPLASIGGRLKVVPSDSTTFLLAVLNGDPSGPGTNDPQKRNDSGTRFRVKDGAFVIAEVQYATNQGDDAKGLPGTFKLGGYWNSEPAADQRFDNVGNSLADGIAPARKRRGSYSMYGVADQVLWKKPGTKDGGVGAFFRVMGAPDDRDLVSFFVQGGATYKGVFSGPRENDTLGLGVTYARIGDRARQLDEDISAMTPGHHRRDGETAIELTYQLALAPWLQVQPDAQYIVHPLGGAAKSGDPRRRIGDAAIFGVRSTVAF